MGSVWMAFNKKTGLMWAGRHGYYFEQKKNVESSLRYHMERFPEYRGKKITSEMIAGDYDIREFNLVGVTDGEN